MDASFPQPLCGTHVVVTRPVGQGRTLLRQIQALGGVGVSLPGVSLRASADATATQQALHEALQSELVIFTSRSAVRFAAALGRLAGPARVATVGRGTAGALRRHGCRDVIVPDTAQNSEGLLAHPALAALAGQRVAVVGAPGGRGLLQAAIRARGAHVTDVYVYHRVRARLNRRHVSALRTMPAPAYVLLSSAETVRNLHGALDTDTWGHLQAAHAVVSSARVGDLALKFGFTCVSEAQSALGPDLLARVVELDAHMK